MRMEVSQLVSIILSILMLIRIITDLLYFLFHLYFLFRFTSLVLIVFTGYSKNQSTSFSI